jgi:hypothetical protein
MDNMWKTTFVVVAVMGAIFGSICIDTWSHNSNLSWWKSLLLYVIMMSLLLYILLSVLLQGRIG